MRLMQLFVHAKPSTQGSENCNFIQQFVCLILMYSLSSTFPYLL
jgi:hypothetical protein